MKLSALQGRISKTFVEVPGGEEGEEAEQVEIHYKPGALTLEVAEEIRKIGMDESADLDVLLVLLEPLVVWWDIESEDGSNLGTSAEEIRKVPLPFLGLVIDKISSEARPNPTIAETSPGSSPPEASPDESRNGTPGSLSPDTLESPPGSLSSVQ